VIGSPKRSNKIIVLLTDFGTSDPYVGLMKAAIYERCPDATVIDLTHSIEPFNIAEGAAVLFMSYRYLPPHSIIVGVVDPGVGSSRRAIVIKSRRYIFVGPDNGLLTLAAEDDGVEEVREIVNENLFRKPVSRSFHGRDIFAPVAAALACGTPLSEVGPQLDISTIVRSPIRVGFEEISEECIRLFVIYVDRFGNLILSDRFERIVDRLGVSIGEKILVKTETLERYATVAEVFSKASVGELVLYRNSFDMAELAVNQGSARRIMGLGVGDPVVLCKT